MTEYEKAIERGRKAHAEAVKAVVSPAAKRAAEVIMRQINREQSSVDQIAAIIERAAARKHKCGGTK
jgi:hypothetical protein